MRDVEKGELMYSGSTYVKGLEYKLCSSPEVLYKI